MFAGTVLGSLEVALLGLEAPPAAPALAGALVLGAALVVSALAGVLGLALGRRPTPHGEMVGALLGPLVLAPGLGASLEVARVSARAGALAAVVSIAAAFASALLASRLGRRLERAGIAVAGPRVWAACALLVAASGRAGSIGRPQGPALLVAALLLAAVLLALGTLTRGRFSPPGPGTWPRRLAGAALLACAVGLGPEILPWLLTEPSQASALQGAPRSLLIAVWRLPGPLAAERAAAESSTAALLAAQGRVFRTLAPEDGPASPQAGLRSAEGNPVLAVLGARGYETAAILRRPDAPDAGAAVRDQRPGVGAYLAGPARQTTAGPLLRVLGPRRLGGLDLGAAFRDPGDATRAARRWLVAGGAAAGRPFGLLVDYRGDVPLSAERLDHELGDLLDLIGEVGALPATTILLLLEDEVGPPSAILREPDGVAADPQEVVRTLDQIAAEVLASSERAPQAVGPDPQ
jgi:hypothetical protein